MARGKAPAWLTTAFANGVVELACQARPRPVPAYAGAVGRCFLAQFDEHKKPCEGRLERAHFLRRGTVEDAIWSKFWGTTFEDGSLVDPAPLILTAAWDPRNGEVGCEGHHRRFDRHIGPLLTVPAFELPARTVAFVFDYDLHAQAEDRWPGFDHAHHGYRDRVAA